MQTTKKKSKSLVGLNQIPQFLDANYHIQIRKLMKELLGIVFIVLVAGMWLGNTPGITTTIEIFGIYASIVVVFLGSVIGLNKLWE